MHLYFWTWPRHLTLPFIMQVLQPDLAWHATDVKSLWPSWIQERRIQDILLMVYKAIHALTAVYIRSLLTLRCDTQGLRSINKLYQPRVDTTNYGKNSFKFTPITCKYWNILTDELSTAPSVTNFRNNIKSHLFQLLFCLILLSIYCNIIVLIIVI